MYVLMCYRTSKPIYLGVRHYNNRQFYSTTTTYELDEAKTFENQEAALSFQNKHDINGLFPPTLYEESQILSTMLL